MNCHRISAGGPAGWLHTLFCASCRMARRTDALLAFGIAQLRRERGTYTALNATLSALNLPQTSERVVRFRQRRRTFGRFALMAAAPVLGLSGWLYYMSWLPAQPVNLALPRNTKGFTALAALARSITYNTPGVDSRYLILESEFTTEPIPLFGVTHYSFAGNQGLSKSELDDSVSRFVQSNADTIEQIHATRTVPCHEPVVQTLDERKQMESVPGKITALLQSDAVWKFQAGDRAGALRSAMDLIVLGANVARAGSEQTREAGLRAQDAGRATLWRLLPNMSAKEAQQSCRELEQVVSEDSALQTTIAWERAYGFAVRQNEFSKPFWRLQIAPTLKSYFVGPANTNASDYHEPSSLSIAIRLCSMSNRQYVENFRAYVDAAEAQYATASQNITRRMESNRWQELDAVNKTMTPAFGELLFYDQANRTANALLLTAIALQGYRTQTGAYPANLQALCPAYLKRPPVDPFQPQSTLHYAPRRLDSDLFLKAAKIRHLTAPPAYLLYSVGPDGTDQRGIPIWGGVRLGPERVDAHSTLDTLVVRPMGKGDIVVGINQ